MNFKLYPSRPYSYWSYDWRDWSLGQQLFAPVIYGLTFAAIAFLVIGVIFSERDR